MSSPEGEGAGGGSAPGHPGSPRPAVVLIDGEHYPPVVVDALEQLAPRYRFLAAVFLGGTEKVAPSDPGRWATEAERIYNLPVVSGPDQVAALTAALDSYRPEVVVDASDEPVVGYPGRFRLISHTLARNVTYEGSDFRFTPPRLDRIATSPSLSVIGTGKRVGKTAISGYLARLLGETAEAGAGSRSGGGASPAVVVVAMGRGGPAEPEVIDGSAVSLGSEELLRWSRAGRHAASDHFEDAVLSRVLTVGCRRCGGGLAGEPLVSNVAEGALRANELGAGMVVFEGSGSSIPPVATDARLLVAGAHQPRGQLAGYLGTYRVLISDAVVLTMAEAPLADVGAVRDLMTAVAQEKPGIPVIPVVFRHRPAQDVSGRRVACFSTAPSVQAPLLKRHLEEEHGCTVRLWSGNLSDRRALADDLRAAESTDVELFLTEIKAAAIDMVAVEAERRELPVVFMDNEPREVSPAQEGDLAETCRRLAEIAQERYERRG